MASAIEMGIFQAVALMPGVSRSGSTLLGGVRSGMTREAAAKFSFMMSAPAILGSFLSEFMKLLDSGTANETIQAGVDAALVQANAAVNAAANAGGLGSLFTVESVIGMLVAAVTGWFAIRFMLKLIARIRFWWFAAYVALVGVVVIIFQLTGFAGFPPIAFPAG